MPAPRRKTHNTKYRRKTTCKLCGSKEELTAHHVYHGRTYKHLSELNGFMITLCNTCHRKVHASRTLDTKIKKDTQREYEQHGSRASFVCKMKHSWLDDNEAKVVKQKKQNKEEIKKLKKLDFKVLENITDSLVFNKEDAVIHSNDLNAELEKNGILYTNYSDIYARMGRYKLIAERQVKETRSQAELDYRNGKKKVEGIDRMTDATVKACVEVDPDVVDAESLCIEFIWWYNKAGNYTKAMEQRIDLLRMLHKDSLRSSAPYNQGN